MGGFGAVLGGLGQALSSPGFVAGYAGAQHEQMLRDMTNESNRRQHMADQYLQMAQNDQSFTPEQRNVFAQGAHGALTTPLNKKLDKDTEGAFQTAMNMPRTWQPPTPPGQTSAPPAQTLTGMKTLPERLSEAQQVASSQNTVPVNPAFAPLLSGGDVDPSQITPGSTVDKRFLQAIPGLARVAVTKEKNSITAGDKGLVKDPTTGTYAPQTDITKLPLVTQAKIRKSQADTTLSEFNSQYKQGLINGTDPGLKAKLAIWQEAIRHHMISEDIAEKGLNLRDLATRYRFNPVDTNGNALPNAPIDPGTGLPIGLDIYKSLQPDATTRAAGSQAHAVNAQGLELLDQIEQMRDKLSGFNRVTNPLLLMAHSPDPDVRNLYNKLQSFYSSQGKFHGWRAIKTREEFEKAVGNLYDGPDGLKAGILGTLSTAGKFEAEGNRLRLHAPGTNPQGPPPPPGGHQLDENTARQILQEAGGDKDKARQLARQRGYTF